MEKIGYKKLLEAYESGQYLGELDERFIDFQLDRLTVVTRPNKSSKRYKATRP